MRALAAALPAIVADPGDMAARGDALYGAWLCGICLGAASMALHHKLAHVLGGSFDLPHAETHAVLLPHAVAYNAPAAPAAMARLARALGGGDPAAALFDLAGRLGAPRALRDIGMPEDGLDRAVEARRRQPLLEPPAARGRGAQGAARRRLGGTAAAGLRHGPARPPDRQRPARRLPAELVRRDRDAARAVPGAGGRGDGRRLRHRRRLHRAVGGAAPRRGRARRGARSRRSASAGAPRGGTAARSAPASGATRAGSRRGSGAERARLLWDLAEEAKALVRGLVERHGIACDLRPGVIHAARRAVGGAALRRGGGEARPRLRLRRGRAARPGGDRGAGRQRRLPRRSARPRRDAPASARTTRSGWRGRRRPRACASSRGAASRRSSRRSRTAAGRVRARFTVLAGNGYLGGLVPEVAARVMPINNFIVATAPLGEEAALRLLPFDEAVADSLFVVNYFRLSADRRLLFGGGESYGYRFPADIAARGAAADAGDLPRPRRDADRLRLGRDAGDHRQPAAGLPAARRRRSSPPPATRATAWRWRRSPAS